MLAQISAIMVQTMRTVFSQSHIMKDWKVKRSSAIHFVDQIVESLRIGTMVSANGTTSNTGLLRMASSEHNSETKMIST